MEKRISWDEAVANIIELVTECDADQLAHMYQDCFGGEVYADDETEELVIEMPVAEDEVAMYK